MITDLSDKEALRWAIDTLSALHPLPTDLLTSYLSGDHEKILYYEKLTGGDGADIPALWKYLVSAEAYIVQPSTEHYYDIFRAARAVPIVRRLAEAIDGLGSNRTPEDKLARLAVETSYDAFDQTAYEFIVAHAYLRVDGVDDVEFLEEGASLTPDLRVIGNGLSVHVECKKFDRARDIAGPLRDEVNSRLKPLFTTLHSRGISAGVELDIKEPDGQFDATEVAIATLDSYQSGGVVMSPTANVLCQPLPKFESPMLTLCPSPILNDRYGYSTRGEWLGLVTRMEARYASQSWVEEIHWDAAVKWKLSSQEHLAKRQKLGHKRLFHGIRQLATTDGPTVLHACYEREGGIGHRKSELERFVSRVKSEMKNREIEPPTAIVFNELDIDVSTGGRFDFVERAHWVSLAGKLLGDPAVTSVFVSPDDTCELKGEWGVGSDLPPIDEES